MTYSVGFVMDQIAGHVADLPQYAIGGPRSSRSSRRAGQEIIYKKPNGSIKQVHRLMPFVPTYVTGVLHSAIRMRRALRDCHSDVLFTNASVRVFFSRALSKVPR